MCCYRNDHFLREREREREKEREREGGGIRLYLFQLASDFSSSPFLLEIILCVSKKIFKVDIAYFTLSFYLFVCLFIWTLSSQPRIFHSHGNVTIAGEGLQILTYDRHSWPLSLEGSLTYHTYCDTGLPFIMVISEDT